MTTIHDFIQVMNDLIREMFPNTEIVAVRGGDYIKDFILELREDKKRLRYSPYAMFTKSENYEETIEDFLTQWEIYRAKSTVCSDGVKCYNNLV